jgi:hypothetical protein
VLAVIESPAEPSVALLPIAGRPLLLRQMQWLRACGFDRVAVEVVAGRAAEEITACLRGDALGWDAAVVEHPTRSDPLDVARRAGFAEGVPILAIPGDVIGAGDLAQAYARVSSCVADHPSSKRGEMPIALRRPPFFLAAAPASLQMLDVPSEARHRGLSIEGWGARITCASDAIALGAAALEKDHDADNLLLHASETSPGVWVGRGARIQDGAQVRPPVLIGAGAMVRAGATVGPRTFVGERAVIERGAVLSDAIVADDTIVGERFTARGAWIVPAGVQAAEPGGTFLEIRDPLILAHRGSAASGAGLPLWIAVVAAALVAIVTALAQLGSGA